MHAEELQATNHALALEGQAPSDAVPQLRADSLAASVLMLVALTVMQRGVGFVREVFFCRWLPAEQLGLWDMAFGFLMLAAPLVILSLPGTFGRYVDRYRQQGQLRAFLRRTAMFCLATALPAVALLVLARPWVSELVFGSAEHAPLVLLLGASLLVLIAFNYLICLFTALRNMRLVSGMELTNSLLFAVLGLGLMCGGWTTADGMVVAYVGSCAVCVVGGLVWLARVWPSLPQTAGPWPRGELWSRVLPFAAWMMAINLLWNLFDVVDRYMIIHFSSGSPADALAEVGNYRSSRVLPLLLASLTAMIASAALPHLSHDWEAGRRDAVSKRMNLLLKTWALVLVAGAAGAMIVAPLLFDVALRGKFAGGLRVLPWTLTYCTWFGLTMLAQNYLWCAERASRATLAALAGVAINVGLNIFLLPRLGLLGAVLATSAANLVALLLVLALSWRFGLRFDRGTLVIVLLPLSISLGPWITLMVLAAVLLEIVGFDRLLSREEKNELFGGAMEYIERVPMLRRFLRMPDRTQDTLTPCPSPACRSDRSGRGEAC